MSQRAGAGNGGLPTGPTTTPHTLRRHRFLLVPHTLRRHRFLLVPHTLKRHRFLLVPRA
ncbi:hypothetical protein [Streptomyces sp. NPDC054863]